jgi:hypothetical protein
MKKFLIAASLIFGLGSTADAQWIGGGYRVDPPVYGSYNTWTYYRQYGVYGGNPGVQVNVPGVHVNVPGFYSPGYYNRPRLFGPGPRVNVQIGRPRGYGYGYPY